VIEEAPAPGMDETTREAICAAAVRAAKAVDYVGAGTIEFIADASEGLRADRIWFMEMNTRLQVEHPVTEEITGQDLVEWQLRVASGEPLPKRQDELEITGHAMEARLYAEDPSTGFLPSIGVLTEFDLNDSAIRSDSGVEEGDEVTPFYDPMIAKLIAHGRDRESAIEFLAEALCRSVVWPVRTNAAFLLRAIRDADFAAGKLDTGLIARKGDDWLPPKLPSEDVLRGAAERLIEDASGAQPRLAGFRLNAPKRLQAVLDVQGSRVPVDFTQPGENWYMRHFDNRVMITDSGQTFAIGFARFDGSGAGSAGDGAILAPMPGRVTSVETAAGDRVTKGQRLVTLEAMKMEHGLTAPFDGEITELNVTQGSQVSEGTLLVKVEKAE